MATTTATILVGHAHQNHGGIIPSHMIRFTENSRPGLILHALDGDTNTGFIIPTLENTVDDIYLMVAVFVLKKVKLPSEFISAENGNLYEVLNESERQILYDETRRAIQEAGIKLVFSIMDESHLLRQVEKIKTYPNDFEIILPAVKKQFDVWAGKVVSKGM